MLVITYSLGFLSDILEYILESTKYICRRRMSFPNTQNLYLLKCREGFKICRLWFWDHLFPLIKRERTLWGVGSRGFEPAGSWGPPRPRLVSSFVKETFAPHWFPGFHRPGQAVVPGWFHVTNSYVCKAKLWVYFISRGFGLARVLLIPWESEALR